MLRGRGHRLVEPLLPAVTIIETTKTSWRTTPVPGQEGWPRLSAALEVAAVLAAPIVLYFALRLRGMAPVQLPDPTQHSAYIFAPHDSFVRFQTQYKPAGLREAARVGFLEPARIAYLLFGAVPGFFVFRYVLALVAIAPVYLLLKRVHGRWAGFVGIAVVMSSPVVVTAWGTDFPDSAAVSYLIGAMAALALAAGDRRRRGWLVFAGAMLTLAVWSHGISVPLVAVLVVVYVAVRLVRSPAGLVRDLALLAGSVISVTGLLAVGSGLLIGQFNFITPTLISARYLSQPGQVRLYHASTWSWAPYDTYLLVPPAIFLAYLAVFAHKWRRIGTPQLFVGLAGGLQLATFLYLQFFGTIQTLEQHYVSSTLWSSVSIMLALIVAEVMRPLVRPSLDHVDGSPSPRRIVSGVSTVMRWLIAAVPTVIVIAVALVYEIGPRVPVMTWGHWGAIVASTAVAGAVVGRLAGLHGRGWKTLASHVSTAAVVVVLGATLVLTVAQVNMPPAGRPPKCPAFCRWYDPIPAYASALGGNDTVYVDEYQVTSEIPAFVGHAKYRGERLLTWLPLHQYRQLLGPMGLFHGWGNLISHNFPVLHVNAAKRIERLHPAQVLLMSLTGDRFERAVRALRRYAPVVVRKGVLVDGDYRLHLWLIDLRRYLRRAGRLT
jgi:hypothetical protein